jgi:hypothetical protein
MKIPTLPAVARRLKTERGSKQTPVRTFSVWSEGYAATGQSSGAQLMGRAQGRTFKEACVNLFKADPYFSADSLTYWACSLYDNEQEARKAFG